MKFLKTLGWLVLLLIVSFLLIAAFSRKDFKTTQSTVINAPQSLVFNTVNDLSTWDSWSAWVEMDPTTVSTMGEKYIGKDGYYTWSGEVSGQGTMKISDTDPPNAISTFVDFGDQGNADANFKFEPADGGTKVSWGFHSHVGFPFNAMMVLMGMKKMIDKDYARGLELLKIKVEDMAADLPPFSVDEIDYYGESYLAHREEVAMDQVSNFYQKYLPAMSVAAQKYKIAMTGMPAGIFYSWDEKTGTSDMAAGVPIDKKAVVPRSLKVYNTNPGKALQVKYYGPYEGTVAAHTLIEEHMKANNQTFVAPCIEQYITDPTTEPDTSKWLTLITYPLQ